MGPSNSTLLKLLAATTFGRFASAAIGLAKVYGWAEDASIPRYARDVADEVQATGRAPRGYKGSEVFANDGRAGSEILPRIDASGKPIEYQAWDVRPYSKGVNRGAERVVTGSDGSVYYTSDHYQTFTRIRK